MPVTPSESDPFEELLVIVICPVKFPAAVGLNWILRVAVCPALMVSGKVTPDVENPAPVVEIALITTAELPAEVNVIDCDAAEFTTTLPNGTDEAFTVSVGTAAEICNA